MSTFRQFLKESTLNESTRSTITVKIARGEYVSIYCHFDGYTTGVGRELKEHFNSYEKATGLLENGNIRTIDDGVAEHYPSEGATKHSSTKGIDTNEFNYLFKDGEWLVSLDHKNRFKSY